MRKISIEEFIEKSNNKHGGKYDYSIVTFCNLQEKINILCLQHGYFSQTASSHINGNGCPACAKRPHIDTQLFIQRSIKQHGYEYNYSKVNYINAHTKVIIICKVHGEFEQLAREHYDGQRCPKCTKNVKLTKEEFISECNLTHNNKYDYSLVNYINAHTKVRIICPKHGEFSQLSREHREGQGCKKCTKQISKPETEWLDSLSIPLEYRNIKIKLNNKTFIFDALDPITNTVYEFHGDYFHGNPKKYKATELNKKCKKTFGELYQRTVEKENVIKCAGYKLVTMWESDWIDEK